VADRASIPPLFSASESPDSALTQELADLAAARL
jgi:hypothetical protein